MGVDEIYNNATVLNWLQKHRDQKITFAHTDEHGNVTISGKGVLRYDRDGMLIKHVRIENATIYLQENVRVELGQLHMLTNEK